MTEEANAHFFGIIMQMIEGHEFVQNQFRKYIKSEKREKRKTTHSAVDKAFAQQYAYFLKSQIPWKCLEVIPKNAWSIDPFGHSPTIAYLLKEANLTHMVIDRIHYSVKKYLSEKKNLEFLWRQLWAGSSSKTDMFTHAFPFRLYGVGASCGPDRQVGISWIFSKVSHRSIFEQKVTKLCGIVNKLPDQ